MRRLRVSYGRTIQTAPFESMRLDVSLEKDIEDGVNMSDEADKSVKALRAYVTNKLVESLAWEKEKSKK